jgi:arylsulfatase A-like enzyme
MQWEFSRNWVDGLRHFLQIDGMMSQLAYFRRRGREARVGSRLWFSDLWSCFGWRVFGPKGSVLGVPNPAGLIKAMPLCLILLSFLVLSQAGGQVADSRPPAPRRPSLVLIVADGLGYGELGCYGQAKIKTPNIDKLASEGLRFTDFYAGSPVGAASYCVLMTGLHAGHVAIRGVGNVSLGAGDITVTELLKGAGYRTGLIGEWELGGEHSAGLPQKKGFEQFLGYLDADQAQDYYAYQLWRFDGKNGYDGLESFGPNAARRRGLFIPELFTTAAQNFLRNYKPDRFNQYRPFFLVLAYTLPHANNLAAKTPGNAMPLPGDAPYSNEPWPQPEKNKAAMITTLDTDVGRLMDTLKQLKIEDNTVVVFTSAHGPHKENGVDLGFFQSSGLLRGGKLDLYEGELRVPLVVRWPARIKAGQVSDLICGFQDVLPTACAFAGTKAPENIDGLSILPTLRGQTQTNRHDFMYWELHEQGFQQAVRMGEWKAVRPQAEKPLELYNLKADLGEKNNVAAQYPEIIGKLESYLKTARTDSALWPVRTNGEPRADGTPKKEFIQSGS